MSAKVMKVRGTKALKDVVKRAQKARETLTGAYIEQLVEKAVKAATAHLQDVWSDKRKGSGIRTDEPRCECYIDQRGGDDEIVQCALCKAAPALLAACKAALADPLNLGDPERDQLKCAIAQAHPYAKPSPGKARPLVECPACDGAGWTVQYGGGGETFRHQCVRCKGRGSVWSDG